MLRTFIAAALLLPAAVQAQAAPAAPEAASRPASVRVDSDPWLTVWGGGATRTTRDNLLVIDRALDPYGTTYAELSADERMRVRQAHADLLPGHRISRTRITEPQARAMAYLALGPWERTRRGCDSRCSVAVDSMSRDAAWIHRAILGLGRTGVRRPRREELATLHEMAERSRQIVVTTPRCGCGGARSHADALLAATREAVDVHEASTMPVWMSLGSERVQRIARISDTLERTLLRCLTED